jgi:hypothetical protein
LSAGFYLRNWYRDAGQATLANADGAILNVFGGEFPALAILRAPMSLRHPVTAVGIPLVRSHSLERLRLEFAGIMPTSEVAENVGSVSRLQISRTCGMVILSAGMVAPLVCKGAKP